MLVGQWRYLVGRPTWEMPTGAAHTGETVTVSGKPGTAAARRHGGTAAHEAETETGGGQGPEPADVPTRPSHVATGSTPGVDVAVPAARSTVPEPTQPGDGTMTREPDGPHGRCRPHGG